MSYLPCIEIETRENVDASIIWLHGLGANGHDFEPIVPELNLPADAALRFVFPHAPSMPVTINGGMLMPAWYDILDISMDHEIDLAGIMRSAGQVSTLIDRELSRGIDSRRIIIAGFSQGGVIAYHVALTFIKPLAGVLALSAYLATWETIKPAAANNALPIMICHGLYDPVVPEPLGRQAVSLLTQMGYKPDYQTYPMQHSVCAEEIAHISDWIQKILEL